MLEHRKSIYFFRKFAPQLNCYDPGISRQGARLRLYRGSIKDHVMSFGVLHFLSL